MCEADKIIDGELVCAMEDQHPSAESMKPCPFCGSNIEPVYSGFELRCFSCNCQLKEGNDDDLLTLKEKWNNAWAHKKISEQERRIAELEKAARRFYKADGSFVQYEGDTDIVGMRINAAKTIEDLERQLKEAKEYHEKMFDQDSKFLLHQKEKIKELEHQNQELRDLQDKNRHG